MGVNRRLYFCTVGYGYIIMQFPYLTQLGITLLAIY